MAVGEFSRAAKDELARRFPTSACCQWAELIGLVQATGVWTPEGAAGAGDLLLRTSSGPVARKAIRLLRERAGGADEEAAPTLVRQTEPGAAAYHVRIGAAAGAGAIRRVLETIEGRSAAASLDSTLLRRTCCKRSYVRGLFLGRGSVADPQKERHLEIGLKSETDAQRLSLALRALGLEPKVVRRSANPFVYLKDGDQIVELLLQVGAHGALLRFEDTQVRKSVRNEINRLVNAETANVDKTITAAMRQIDAIERLKRTGALEELPDGYRELAELRLEHPYANLAELGHLLSRPLTKSGVSYRMKRLVRLAGLDAPEDGHRIARATSAQTKPQGRREERRFPPRNDRDGIRIH